VTTLAVTNYGVQLKRSNMAATPVFAAIAEVVNIDPPGLENVVAEATPHVAGGGYREFIATGLKDLGEFTIDINYVPTDGDHDVATGLLGDVISGETLNWQLLFPDTTVWAFAAIVKMFKPEGAEAKSPDTLKAKVTFRTTGTPTLL
jgi:hypothetical protein